MRQDVWGLVPAWLANAGSVHLSESDCWAAMINWFEKAAEKYSKYAKVLAYLTDHQTAYVYVREVVVQSHGPRPEGTPDPYETGRFRGAAAQRTLLSRFVDVMSKPEWDDWCASFYRDLDGNAPQTPGALKSRVQDFEMQPCNAIPFAIRYAHANWPKTQRGDSIGALPSGGMDLDTLLIIARVTSALPQLHVSCNLLVLNVHRLLPCSTCAIGLFVSCLFSRPAG